jgi:hypothetical protein
MAPAYSEKKTATRGNSLPRFLRYYGSASFTNRRDTIVRFYVQ